MKDTVEKRSRNASATREAILDSAFAAFARGGYDGVGLREIAGNAGVTAMLINRYFGSKENLFREVVGKAMNAPSVMTAEFIRSEGPGRAIARALVAKTGRADPPLDGMRIILNSASNPNAAAIIRTEMEKHHHTLMQSAIGTDHSAERAAIVLSIVAGFQFMRQMIGLSALTDTDPGEIESLLGNTLQSAIGATNKKRADRSAPFVSNA